MNRERIPITDPQELENIGFDGVPAVEAYTIEGFDPTTNWNPTVVKVKDGTIKIEFPEFPPDVVYAHGGDDGDGHAHTFEDIIAKAIGADVYQEDRELFIIEYPLPDTMDKLAKFFMEYE
jgi:hypothetical protein